MSNTFVTGSYHLPQSDGWGHAADIVPRGSLLATEGSTGGYAAIHLVEAELEGIGLKRYVSREPWHYQALGRWDGWLAGPEPGDEQMSAPASMYRDTDQRPEKYKLSVPGVGITPWLDDVKGSADMWETRIGEAARTGVLSGPWVSDLFGKLEPF